jgi:hypothetical protein
MSAELVPVFRGFDLVTLIIAVELVRNLSMPLLSIIRVVNETSTIAHIHECPTTFES